MTGAARDTRMRRDELCPNTAAAACGYTLGTTLFVCDRDAEPMDLLLA
jgi:hypothetical protein